LSYTVDTLESLRYEFPDSNIYFILGSDSFQQLNQWHRWQEIIELANIVIAQRPDCESDTASEIGIALKQRFCSNEEIAKIAAGKITRVSVSQLEISASRVRELVRQKKSIQYLLPDSVVSFIKHEKLYLAD